MIKSDTQIAGADNRGLRYGDGLFETIRVSGDQILLESFHFDRLFSGLNSLQFEIPEFFTREFIKEEILSLCKKNITGKNSRVRLAIFRGNGGLYDVSDHKPNVLIQAWPLSTTSLNENGLVIGVYPEARKTCDIFANIKSANYLPYIMGALYAQKNKWNDSLILNSHGRICDATIANVFCLKNKRILTPALNEGCVAGVMRRNLVTSLPQAGFIVEEIALEISDLMNADEIFLTNAIHGIRWVKEFQEKTYSDVVAQRLFQIVNGQ